LIIKAFGLFWRADEINWSPGGGNTVDISKQFRLLGRRGANKGTLKVSDFRTQQGIYILYGDLGPHYVGLTTNQLGSRLKDHMKDRHQGLWDRFSWFGFRGVLKSKDGNGFRLLKEMPEMNMNQPDRVIGDIEALLARAMSLKNKAMPNFDSAEEWTQIKLDEILRYCSKT
jgi:hypothetical protein